MGPRTLKGFTLAAALAAASCGGKAGDPAVAPVAEEKVVHVYNWIDFIGKTTISDFEAATGIRVVYDTFDANETLETKLLTGHSGYDVVFPSSTYMGRVADAGALLKLDKARLPAYSSLDSEILRQIALNDPGNEHAIAYTWGTTGIAWVPDLVRKALGTATIDSWSAVFDPAVAQKLARCGITMLDSRDDVFEAAEIYLGTDPGNEDLQELAAAEAMLKRVRPYVRNFDSGDYPGLLANGEICVAIAWNGVKRIARTRQDGSSSYQDIEYVQPREGAPAYFDSVAIPVDAPHPDNAYAFLNFLMRPEVIAGVTNTVGYANANPASLPFVDAELKGDPAVYPPPEVRARLHTTRKHSQEYARELNRAWTRVRTGQ